jgi:hypothetical protein
MADDQRYRSYRSAEPYARSARGGRAADSDPLAELARLIGQESGGGGADSGARRPTARREPAVDSPPQGQADWPDRPAMPRAADTWERPQERAEAPDPYRPRGGEGRDAEMESPRYVDPPLRADEGGRYDEQGYAADGDAYAAAGYDTGYDNGAEADAAGAYGQQETYYEDEQAGEDDEEEMYEDLPPERRRGGFFKALVVLGLAATVTGGAFGYRAMSNGAVSPDDPPVIKADTTPSKVAPQGADSQQNKLIYDRVGSGDKAAGSPERLVSREEQPVDVNAARSAAPRVVSGFGVTPAGTAGAAPFPASPAAQSSPPPAAGAAPPPAAGGTAPGYEPKRVSTVRIKPDSPFGSDSTGAAASDTTGAAPARPGGDKGRAATPAPDADAGIAEPAPAPAKPSRTRTASVAPVVPAGTEAGGFVVQVSAQNSEEEALRSFKTLQTKYPKQLGNREPIISKVDTATGTKYRTQFGPFASADQATQACNSLKAAGGECLIRKN